MKRVLLSTAIFTVILLGSAVVNQALAGFPPPPPPSSIPIDGLSGVLIAAAAVYGSKKIYDKRKSKEG